MTDPDETQPAPSETLPGATSGAQPNPLGALPPATPRVYRPRNRRAQMFWLGFGLALVVAVVVILALA